MSIPIYQFIPNYKRMHILFYLFILRMHILKAFFLDFTGGPVVKALSFHCKGVWVTSLVGEPRSHLLLETKKKSAFAAY